MSITKKTIKFITSRTFYLALGIFLAAGLVAYATWDGARTGGSGELTEANWNEIVTMIENEIGGGMQMKTGTYVGNGVDNRNIDIGVDLSSMTYKWIVIRAVPGYRVAVQKFGHDTGDMSRWFSDGVQYQNLIQAWTQTGFQIGNDEHVNTNAMTFNYVVFWQS